MVKLNGKSLISFKSPNEEEDKKKNARQDSQAPIKQEERGERNVRKLNSNSKIKKNNLRDPMDERDPPQNEDGMEEENVNNANNVNNYMSNRNEDNNKEKKKEET